MSGEYVYQRRGIAVRVESGTKIPSFREGAYAMPAMAPFPILEPPTAGHDQGCGKWNPLL